MEVATIPDRMSVLRVVGWIVLLGLGLLLWYRIHCYGNQLQFLTRHSGQPRIFRIAKEANQKHVQATHLYDESRRDWKLIPSSSIYVSQMCMDWVQSSGVVTGQLQVQKRGGAWNQFGHAGLFPQTYFRLKCNGKVFWPEPKLGLFTPMYQTSTGWMKKLKDWWMVFVAKQELPTWIYGAIGTLTTGDQTYLTPTFKQALQKTALWHIFVISGMHVYLFFACWLFLCRWVTGYLRFLYGGLVLEMFCVCVGIILFPLWFGLTPSAMRGLCFYGCFWVVPPYASASLRIGLKAGLIAILLSGFPHFFFQCGFWMSLFASFGFWAWMVLFQNISGVARWGGVMIGMNIWMMPWISYLSGLVIWPCVLGSPFVFIFLAMCGVGALSSTLFNLQYRFEGVPSLLLKFIHALPEESIWVVEISEVGLWCGCALWLCVMGVILSRRSCPSLT